MYPWVPLLATLSLPLFSSLFHPSVGPPLSHPLAAFPFSAALHPLPSVLALCVYEGSKIRDVTPGAYDSRHYCPSKLTVRYYSPPPTSLPLLNKFLSPFGLQDFRFRPQLLVSHSNTPRRCLSLHRVSCSIPGAYNSLVDTPFFCN